MLKGVRKNNDGLSLLEITVVMSIVVIIIVISSDFIVNGLKSTTFASEQEDAIKNARKALNSLTKEIREAAPSTLGSYIFATTTSQELIFYSNINSDPYVERIRYFVDGTELKKGVTVPQGTPLAYLNSNETVEVVANHLNNQGVPVFNYFDTNNTLISTANNNKTSIRLIQIFLKVNVTPEIAPGDYILSTDVQIRNLKDNL